MEKQAAPAKDKQLETNKSIVRDYYNMAFNLQKPEEAVSRYLHSSYRQHNPGAGDGAAPFIAFAKGFLKAYPDLHFDFKRMVAEGDLVVVHSHLTLKPGDRGSAVVDIFRLENGKIAEHWDVVQEVPEKSANDNTMF
jgi:predicted SnoaL-like aldol condensation-catalyzing enzyme